MYYYIAGWDCEMCITRKEWMAEIERFGLTVAASDFTANSHGWAELQGTEEQFIAWAETSEIVEYLEHL